MDINDYLDNELLKLKDKKIKDLKAANEILMANMADKNNKIEALQAENVYLKEIIREIGAIANGVDE